MENITHRNAAATLLRIVRPYDKFGRDMNAVMHALNGVDAKSVDAMCREVESLAEAGCAQQAAERAHTFLYPKFKTQSAARDAYEVAMAAKRARAA